MSEGKKNDKVSIVFENAKEAPVFPVTGVWGGVTISGNSVHAKMFVEHGSTPNIINVDVDEKGRLKNPNTGDRISRGQITRNVQASLVMAPEDAISIGKWLIDKGQQVINLKNNK